MTKVRTLEPDGQLTLDGDRLASPTLPDKLPESLHTLFVGIMPATSSAMAGHYFAGRNNSFWKLLQHSGIAPVQLDCTFDDALVKLGFGFTDTTARASSGAHLLSRTDFAKAKTRIQSRVAKFKPRLVVFVGKTAAVAYSGRQSHKLQYGLQKWDIDGTPVFLVPSTSGRSLSHCSYPERLRWFRLLKEQIDLYWAFP